MKNSLKLGPVFFAVAAIASGLLQLTRQDFVRLVPKVPSWVPSPTVWAMVMGGILVCAGVALLMNKGRRIAASVLGLLLFGVLVLYLPGVFANPSAGYMWTNPCKTLALLGGTILLGMKTDSGSALNRYWLLGAVSLGVFLMVCGVQHFVYADFVTQLVPAWMPGRCFWALLTGVALVAGGIGLIIPKSTLLAARMVALMIFLWVWLLHIPRALTTWPDAGETAAIFEALAIAGTALIVGECRSKKVT